MEYLDYNFKIGDKCTCCVGNEYFAATVVDIVPYRDNRMDFHGFVIPREIMVRRNCVTGDVHISSALCGSSILCTRCKDGRYKGKLNNKKKVVVMPGWSGFANQ